MRVKPRDEELASYSRRVANLERHVVLPARIAVILSCVILLWPIIAADIGAKNLASLLRWSTAGYAALSLLYWLYVFRFAQRLQSMALTKSVVFASSLTDNAFLGVLLYALAMRFPGEPPLGAGAEASIFGVYCALLLRNVLLFPRVMIHTLINLLYIVGYVSAILFSMWLPKASQLTAPTEELGLPIRSPSGDVSPSAERSGEGGSRPRFASPTSLGPGSSFTDIPAAAKRELLSRAIILCLVSVCSSAIYTLRQRQQRQIDEAQERTIRSLRLDIAGMLAAQVAHELKNPLSIMKNASFLLRKSSAPLDTAACTQLGIIEDEIARANSIITELLDYAKLAEGRIERVAVNDALDDALSGLKHELTSRSITVTTDYSLDLPFLFIDPGQLKQLFTNLFLNAAEAMEDGGAISISSAYSRDGFIEVSIADTGKGIPPEHLRTIFKPFFTTKEKGTGMGLAIVHNLVRAYRGSISVQSSDDVGTTFHLRFPTRLAMLTAGERFGQSPGDASLTTPPGDAAVP